MAKGIIGKKLGMTQIFEADGKFIPVTVVLAGPCTVIQNKTEETDGYNAIQVGFGEVSEKKAVGHLPVVYQRLAQQQRMACQHTCRHLGPEQLPQARVRRIRSRT